MHATRHDLVSVIGERTLHISDKAKLAQSVAAFLADGTYKIDINSLMRDVMQYRLERGVVEANVVSAYPLDRRVVDDITALLREHFPAAKAVKLDNVVDASLVGGVRIELPQENLDLSIRSKLNRFKRLVSEERN